MFKLMTAKSNGYLTTI